MTMTLQEELNLTELLLEAVKLLREAKTIPPTAAWQRRYRMLMVQIDRITSAKVGTRIGGRW